MTIPPPPPPPKSKTLTHRIQSSDSSIRPLFLLAIDAWLTIRVVIPHQLVQPYNTHKLNVQDFRDRPLNEILQEAAPGYR